MAITQATPTATTRARRRFTADEYHRMAEAGILGEDERVELLGGDVVEMSPVGDRHIEGVNRCTRRFTIALGERAVVSPQNPVRLTEHDEPQPDLAVAGWPRQQRPGGCPGSRGSVREHRGPPRIR